MRKQRMIHMDVWVHSLGHEFIHWAVSLPPPSIGFDNQVTQQLRRQNVKRHHGFVVADRHHGPLAAVGAGGEIESLTREKLG